MNSIKDILRNSSLRPTKQRIMIGKLLFNDTDKHVTAESLYRELKASKQKISLATVYNTLHDFCEKKLLKKVNVDAEKIYFDTNTNPHHHFYSDSEKLLIDISKDKSPEYAKIFMGCAVWDQGQLDNEILENSWIISNSNKDLIFHNHLEFSLWKKCLKDMGIDPSKLVSYSGSA